MITNNGKYYYLVDVGLPCKVACEIKYTRLQIEAAVKRMSREITDRHTGEDITLVTVLEGGGMLADALWRWLVSYGGVGSITRDSIQVRRNRGEDTYPGGLSWVKVLSTECAGKTVILAEDSVRTGEVLGEVERLLGVYGVERVECAALVDCRGHRLGKYNDLLVDYVGFTTRCTDDLIGYGMGSLGRDLDCIVVYPEFLKE